MVESAGDIVGVVADLEDVGAVTLTAKKLDSSIPSLVVDLLRKKHLMSGRIA